MGLTLGQVIQDIRLRSPFYGTDTVSNRVLGQALGTAQRRLALLATQRSATYLAQKLTVAFALTDANTVGEAGVSTTGGLPGGVDASGALTLAETNFGVAPVYALDEGTVVWSTVPVSTATTNTVTPIGAPGWTLNAFVGDLVVIDNGNGYPQVREIVSNTVDTLTIDGTWSTVPDSTSTLLILTNVPLSAERMGVVTNLPAFGQETGYLVRLDANGSPVLDLTKPLNVSYAQGMTLPPMDRLLGVQAYWTGANTAEAVSPPQALTTASFPVPIVSYADSQRRPYQVGCYMLGNELFLTGTATQWTGVQNLDIRYVPIPPVFGTGATALEEYFLLPDTANEVLECYGCVTAAEYAVAKGLPADVEGAKAECQASTAVWLKSVGQQTGGHRRTAPRNR